MVVVAQMTETEIEVEERLTKSRNLILVFKHKKEEKVKCRQ